MSTIDLTVGGPAPAGSPRRAAPRGGGTQPTGKSDRTGGFALILTITLLSFLVVLVLALTVFARVETQVAINQQRQAQARQNAVLGLTLALGQLQRYAGPD